MAQQIYSIAADTLNGVVDLGELLTEIQAAPAVGPSPNDVSSSGDQLIVTFAAALTPAQSTTLLAVVNAHTGALAVGSIPSVTYTYATTATATGTVDTVGLAAQIQADPAIVTGLQTVTIAGAFVNTAFAGALAASEEQALIAVVAAHVGPAAGNVNTGGTTATQTYPTATATATGVVDLPALVLEIQADPAITTPVTTATEAGGNINIVFATAPAPAEVTALAAVVAAHQGAPPPTAVGYPYSIAADTAAGTVDPAALSAAIAADPTVALAPDAITVTGDVLTVTYATALTPAQSTALLAVVNAHNGGATPPTQTAPAPVPPVTIMHASMTVVGGKETIDYESWRTLGGVVTRIGFFTQHPENVFGHVTGQYKADGAFVEVRVFMEDANGDRTELMTAPVPLPDTDNDWAMFEFATDLPPHPDLRKYGVEARVDDDDKDADLRCVSLSLMETT